MEYNEVYMHAKAMMDTMDGSPQTVESVAYKAFLTGAMLCSKGATYSPEVVTQTLAVLHSAAKLKE